VLSSLLKKAATRDVGYDYRVRYHDIGGRDDRDRVSIGSLAEAKHPVAAVVDREILH
jgi:hypothetical protein